MIKIKIVYIVILLEILLLNVLYIRFWPLWLLIMALLIPVILKICQIITAKGISVIVDGNYANVYKGDNMAAAIIINSKRNLLMHRIRIKYRYHFSYSDESRKETIDEILCGKNSIKLEICKACDHIGILNIEIENIYIYDMMCLFSKKISYPDGNIKINIVPRRYENAGIRGINVVKDIIDSDKFSTKKPGDDPSEIFELREYKEGDRLNSIHWKLTSKTNKLLIKEFSLPLSDNDIIIFDNRKCDINKLDTMYEGILSLVYLMLYNEREITVICMDDDTIDTLKVKGYEDVDGFICGLISKMPVKNKDIMELTDLYYDGKINGNIYFITDRYDINKTYNNISHIFAVDSEFVSDKVTKLEDWIIYG